MGVMKRSLVLVLFLSLAFCMRANASVTVEQSTSPEYIINSGYSQVTAEEITIMKNRIDGKPVEPLYEKKQNKFVRFCRRVYGYIDPSIDTEERYYHDINMSPSWKDL